MLKDVSDSQRLNVRFYEEEGAVLANCVSVSPIHLKFDKVHFGYCVNLLFFYRMLN